MFSRKFNKVFIRHSVTLNNKTHSIALNLESRTMTQEELSREAVKLFNTLLGELKPKIEESNPEVLN